MFSIALSGNAYAVLTVDISKAPPKAENETGEVDLKTTTGAYSVIKSQKIQGRYADLSSVIEHEVGVQIRSFGGFGSFSTAILRGASSEQVMVYLDGVALNDASTGAFNLSNIPVENIDRIEVYRGVTPIELSGASIGGAINIITKKAKDKRAANIKISAGSFSTEKITAGFNANGHKNDVLMSLDYLQSDNDYEFLFDNGTRFNEDDDFLVNVNNDQVEQNSLLLKWNRLTGIDSNFDTRLKIFNKDKGIPGKSNSPDVTTSYETESYDFLTQFTKNKLFNGLADINVKLDLYKSDELFDDRLAQLGALQSVFNYQTERISSHAYSLFHINNSQLKVLFAGSKEVFEFSDERLNIQESKNNRDSFELSLEHQSYYLYKSLVINLGYRYQEIKDSLDYAVNSIGESVEQDDKNYTVSDPQVGVRYEFDSMLSVAANVGRYTRIPTFVELFGNQGLFRGNEELKEETSINSDIGLTYSFFDPGGWLNDASMYFGLFHNNSENLIIRNYNPAGIGVSENLSDAIINGFEYQLKLYPVKLIQLNFNMTLLDSTLSSSITNFDNNSLPGQYGQSYNLYLSYSHGNWQYVFQQDYKADMHFERGNDHDGQNIYTADFSVIRRWKNQSLELQVNNLTDENHIQFNSRPLPGTVYLLTYQYYFNKVR